MSDVSGPPPVGPSSYPKAQGVNASPDQAFLRPLRIPLWDTEIYVPGKDCRKIRFFSTGIGERFMMAPDRFKTDCDTNIHEGGILGYPLEFTVLKFNLFVEDVAGDEDKALMLDGGKIQFEERGMVHDGIPLIALPRRKREPDIEDVMIELLKEPIRVLDYDVEKNPGISVNELRALAQKRMSDRLGDPGWPYNLGKEAFKIKSTAKFGLIVTWNKPPEPSRPLRLTALIDGLKWSPL